MTSMPGLPKMTWNYEDQLQCTEQVGSSATTFYVYDNRGERLRKVTEHAGQVTDNIYIGQFERYSVLDGSVAEQRETLHVMATDRRVALIETITQSRVESDNLDQIIRYQFANHIQSVKLELDGNGEVVTYEEYTPYGNTSYQAVQTGSQHPKRYRFC
jgi:hypothetical protein